MEEIKAPKKERKFLKAMGEIGLNFLRYLLLDLGKKVINKVGKKREGLVIAMVLLASSLAFAQYPTTVNKQRLGYQTTGDGLVWRGRAVDTVSLKPSTINNAYHLFDTINNVLFSYIKTKGGWKFNNSDTVIIQGVTMPFDSITFNTAKDGTVSVGEVEYNDTQGSLIQGLKGGNVTNVIGQQLHQRVNNQTGSTLTKGTAVYLSGSQGNRITAAKALATSDPTSANTFGIVAENILNNSSGYVITEGLITGINTSGLVEDSAVYLSPTVAGGLTSTKPQAPNHGVYIGVCVKSNLGSGELFVKVKNGLELDELHDVKITSPTNNASLYYKSNEGIWRDTTVALLVSDTSSMLTNYLRSGVASNTYLPLTGGILSKLSSSNNFTDSILKISYTPPLFANDQNITGLSININNRGYTTTGITSEVSTVLNNAISVKGKATQSDVNGTGIAYGVIGEAAASGSGINGSTYAGYFTNTSTVGGNHYGLYVSTASGGDYGIYQTGTGINYFGSNSLFDGTLGVTGATTLSNLAGTGTRMVTASSTGLLSTQTIPTGTVTSVSGTGAISVVNGTTTPVISVADAAFGTAGIVTATGTQQFSGDKVFEGITQFNARAVFKDYTYTATRLAGLSSTDRFATVTLGTGLVLSSGVLSAISGVTSVTASTPLSSSGGTIPNISITDASASLSGVVNTTTQSFAGNKTFTGNVIVSGSSTLNVGSNGTFGGRVNTPWLERTYTTSTATSLTVSVNTTWLNIHQDNLVTLTLPNAATYPGKELYVKQTGTGQVQSASLNVIAFGTAFNAGITTTGILIPSGSVRSATLVSDGTYWVIMSRGN